MTDRLDPYVPLLSRRVAALGSGVHRVDAALVFADVSGYTRLSERLSALGRRGGEVLTEAVNACFTALIDEVHAADGEVLRFGGDALFIAFSGDGRWERAHVSARRMQRSLRALPSIEAPGGRVRLRMSVGIADGSLRLAVCPAADGSIEVLPFGAAVSEVLAMESAAQSGEIRCAPRTALTTAGEVGTTTTAAPAGSKLLVSPSMADVYGVVAAEHRSVVLSFVQVRGADSLSDDAAAEHLGALAQAVEQSAADLGVALLGSDVSGDGLKLILGTGVPIASEDDEERLIAATRRLVTLNTPLRLRAGVHGGVVFCGDVGHPQRRTFTVMGDVVNLTARLMANTADGTVLASAALLDRCRRTYSVEWREPFMVKGKKHPVLAGVVGEVAASAADELALVGRVELIRMLRGAVADGAAHVAIVGPAGCGATRLALYFRDHLVAPAIAGDAVTVTSTVADASVPLQAARRLADALGVARQEFDDASAGVSDAAVGRAVAELIDVHRRRRLLIIDGVDRMDPLSQQVIRRLIVADHGLVVTTQRSGTGDAPGHVARSAIVEVGPLPDDDVEVLAALASRRPLARPTMQRLVALSQGNPRTAILLARTPPTADGDLPDGLEAALRAQVDALPTSVRSSVRAAAVLGESVLVADIAALLAAAGIDAPADLADAAPVLVPAGEHRVRFAQSAARQAVLDNMLSTERRALSAAAARLLSQRVDASVVAGGASSADDANDSLGADAIVETTALVAEQWYSAGVREQIITWSLLAADQAAARGWSVPELHHLRRALQAVARPRPGVAEEQDVDRVALAERAADAADRVGESELALSLLRTAVGWLASDDPPRAVSAAAGDRAATAAPATSEGNAAMTLTRARLLRKQAVQLDWLGRSRAAMHTLGRAVSGLQGLSGAAVDHERCEIAIEQTLVPFFTGSARPTAAAAVVRQARATGDTRLIVRALHVAEMFASSAGDETAADQLFEEAMELVQRLPPGGESDRLRASLVTNRGVTLGNRYESAASIAMFLEAAAISEREGDLRRSANALTNVANALVDLGDVDGAVEVAARARRELAAIGSRSEFAAALSAHGHALAWRGELDEGLRILAEAADTEDLSGDAESIQWRDQWRAELFTRIGRFDEARTLIALHEPHAPTDALRRAWKRERAWADWGEFGIPADPSQFEDVHGASVEAQRVRALLVATTADDRVRADLDTGVVETTLVSMPRRPPTAWRAGHR